MTGVLQQIRRGVTSAEGIWFDLTRAVNTSGFAAVESLTLTGTGRSGFDYLPTRPARIRAVLRDLPVANHSDYIFVDLGSGKGRGLLVAAEFPFQRIEGVELAQELHAIAVDNINRARTTGRKCDRIRSLHLDALDYHFPLQNLVIYMFNPFGEEVMKQVFANLEATLAGYPRHIVVAAVTPQHAGALDRLKWLTCWRKTPHYRIYQTKR